MDAAPLLGLRGGLARRARALALPGHDDLEVAVDQLARADDALAFGVDQARVRIEGEVLGTVPKAHPRRRHDVGVDVVEQVGRVDVRHGEVELATQLTPDQLQVLGQEQDPLARRERDDARSVGLGLDEGVHKSSGGYEACGFSIRIAIP